MTATSLRRRDKVTRALFGIHPDRQTRTELLAAVLALIPHEENDNTQKAVTILLVGAWAIMTLLVMLGEAQTTKEYIGLSMWVAGRYFKIQEQEATRIQNKQSEQQ